MATVDLGPVPCRVVWKNGPESSAANAPVPPPSSRFLLLFFLCNRQRQGRQQQQRRLLCTGTRSHTWYTVIYSRIYTLTEIHSSKIVSPSIRISILDEVTQNPYVVRAIEVSHAACKDEFRRNPRYQTGDNGNAMFP